MKLYSYLIRFVVNKAKAVPYYVYLVTKSDIYTSWIKLIKKTGTISNINAKEYSSFKIPLPPIGIQQQIVTQIEKEQKAVEATKNLITLFEQKIKDRIAKVWGEK